MSDKSSKKKTQNTDSINVSLEFDNDGSRTWANKNRFDKFESDYQQTQEASSLSTISSVEFEIHIRMVKIETKLAEIKKWIPMTTVYCGDNGIKLFIKHKFIEMVYAYEDSDWEIQSTSIIRFYKQKNNKQQPILATLKCMGLPSIIRDSVYKHLLVKHLMCVYLNTYT